MILRRRGFSRGRGLSRQNRLNPAPLWLPEGLFDLKTLTATPRVWKTSPVTHWVFRGEFLMKHHLFAVLLLSFTAALQAQHVEVSISQSEMDTMHYRPQRLIQRAIDEFDRADCEMGFQHLTEAAELAPEAITLQLELGRIAINLAESGDCAEDVTHFLEVARAAYERALNNPDIPTWHRIRAERDLEQIPRLEAENHQRLENRQESFQDYIQSASVTTQLTGPNIAAPNAMGGWGGGSGGAGTVRNVSNINQFYNMLEFEGPVLVDFNADWCGPCKAFEPTLRQYARQNRDVRVLSVDVDRGEDIADAYGISSIPALLVFRGGEEVNRCVGGLPLDALDRFVGH